MERSMLEVPKEQTNFKYGQGRSELDFKNWRELVTKIVQIANDNEWNKSEVANRIGMAPSTFSSWFDCSYAGRFDTNNKKVQIFIDSFEDAIQKFGSDLSKPAFIHTQISQQIIEQMQAAQLLSKISMICTASGLGKTETALYYKNKNPKVFYAQMHQGTSNPYNAMPFIAREIGLGDVGAHNAVNALIDFFRKQREGTLLIIDECQNLNIAAINQLRCFVDRGIGIAFLGNNETYNLFSNGWNTSHHYAQIRSRILMSMSVEDPFQSDIVQYIAAWSIHDGEMVKFLTKIGEQPGALRLIEQTLCTAKTSANGANRDLTLSDLKAAWVKCEGFRNAS